MRKALQILLTVAITFGCFSSVATQQVVLRHVAVEHAAGHSHTAREAGRVSPETLLDGETHSHVLILEQASVGRSSAPSRDTPVATANHPPMWTIAGSHPKTRIHGLDSAASPHPLEQRQLTLRI
jgi:hypothetical protein